jgi:ribosomal protein S18 acetylase RimI-like enzyme
MRPIVDADPKQLEQPPWSALTTTHASFALGNELARRYRPDIAPMAAVREVSDACLQALVSIMQPGDVVGLFNPEPVASGGHLVAVMQKTVDQMVFEPRAAPRIGGEHVTLTDADVPEMMRLVDLTQPGPFAARTIVLGSYIGIRKAGQLVAMAGERMRFDGFTEISAVCTHPDHRGRGHSSYLVTTLMHEILQRGETPFLHLFSDNTRAASLYRKLGFTFRRSLAVTVLKRSA